MGLRICYKNWALAQKAQTSLRIHTVWSALLFFADAWKVSYLNLKGAKFQFSTEETGLNIALSGNHEEFLSVETKYRYM